MPLLCSKYCQSSDILLTSNRMNNEDENVPYLPKCFLGYNLSFNFKNVHKLFCIEGCLKNWYPERLYSK